MIHVARWVSCKSLFISIRILIGLTRNVLYLNDIKIQKRLILRRRGVLWYMLKSVAINFRSFCTSPCDPFILFFYVSHIPSIPCIPYIPSIPYIPYILHFSFLSDTLCLLSRIAINKCMVVSNLFVEKVDVNRVSCTRIKWRWSIWLERETRMILN